MCFFFSPMIVEDIFFPEFLLGLEKNLCRVGVCVWVSMCVLFVGNNRKFCLRFVEFFDFLLCGGTIVGSIGYPKKNNSFKYWITHAPLNGNFFFSFFKFENTTIISFCGCNCCDMSTYSTHSFIVNENQLTCQGLFFFCAHNSNELLFFSSSQKM